MARGSSNAGGGENIKIDNLTIAKNLDQELEAVGFKSKTSWGDGDKYKIWFGNEQEYDEGEHQYYYMFKSDLPTLHWQFSKNLTPEHDSERNISIHRVAYGNGKFIAIPGQSAESTTTGDFACDYIYVSEDGINWEMVQVPLYLEWQGVAYGNGRFILIGANSTTGLYSEDGYDWQEMELPYSSSWIYQVTFAGDKFFVGGLLWSEDGENWNWIQSTGGSVSIGWDIVYGNGKYLGFRSGTNTYCTSDDGIRWSQADQPFSDHTVSGPRAAYGNGMFVVSGDSSNWNDREKLFYSADGETWQQKQLGSGGSSTYFNCLTFDGEKFIGFYGSQMWTSVDGIDWEAGPYLQMNIGRCVLGNGILVAIPPYGGDYTYTYSNSNPFYFCLDTEPTIASKIYYRPNYENTSLFITFADGNRFTASDGLTYYFQEFEEPSIITVPYPSAHPDYLCLIADKGIKLGYSTIAEVNDNSQGEYITNIATNTSTSVSVLGEPTYYNFSTNIGYESCALYDYSTSLGYGARSYARYSTSLGQGANAGGFGSIQIGPGNTNDEKTLYVGFQLTENVSHNYKLLDGNTGLIPDERISSNIARISDIPSQQNYDPINHKNDQALPLWEGTEQEWEEGGEITWHCYSYVNNLAWQPTEFFCPGANSNYNMCYGNGKFLQTVIDDDLDGRYILYQSEDGINWEPAETNLPQSFGSPYFVNDKFIMTNNQDIYISEDGINWEGSYYCISGNPKDFAYGNGLYVTISMNENKVAYSEDAINWTSVVLNDFDLPEYNKFRNIVFANGKFFVLVNNKTILYSTDAINWTQEVLPVDPSTNLVYGNGKLLLIQKEFDQNRTIIAYSEDGIEWLMEDAPLDIFPSNELQSNSFLTFGNGKFFTTNAYSEDGLNWFYLNTESITLDSEDGHLVYGNGKLVLEIGDYSSWNLAYLNIPQEEPNPCYLLDSEPNEDSIVYSEPNVESELTVENVVDGTLTLSDGNSYGYNSAENIITTDSIANVHPDWLCNIKGVGVKIGNTMIAEVNDAELKSRVSTLESRLEALEAQLNNS